MKQFKYIVAVNNVAAFTTTEHSQVKDFIISKMTAPFSLAVTLNGKTIGSKDLDYPAWKSAIEEQIKNRIFDMIWQSADFDWDAKVGDKGKSKTINGITMSWECTSGRAPSRPKHVIAAEKAAIAAKHAIRRERAAKWEEERRLELINLRQRVKHQVDHAFALGKSGTEAASKFITCQHCNSPAEYLGLSMKLSGAAVIDEDTIAGVLCKNHNTHPYYSQNWGEKIACSRLEFFYDGVRQIAVKP